MLQDLLNRPMKNLRISVTDRCNFRCLYCMPLSEYEWVDKGEILSFEEIVRLVRIFVLLGVEKVRLTGGEPLLRKELEKLIAQLSMIDQLKDISLTTNGFFLSEKVSALQSAGLRRINLSLDSLNSEKFRTLTKNGDLSKVLKGLFAAKEIGLHPIKINVVVVRGINEDEIIDLVRFSRANNFFVRFIEYMDVGNSNGWDPKKLVSKREMLQTIHSHFPLAKLSSDPHIAPAEEYHFLDGMGQIGIVASVTEPFCFGCARARLTADGKLVTCLFSSKGHDLKEMIRTGATDHEIKDFISEVWRKRSDRYSQERWKDLNASKGYDAKGHKKMEMITLGG